MNGEDIVRQVIEQVVVPELIKTRTQLFHTSPEIELIPDNTPFIDFEALSNDLWIALQSRPITAENEMDVLRQAVISSFSYCVVHSTMRKEQEFFRKLDESVVFFAFYSSAVLMAYPVSLGFYYANARDPGSILDVMLNDNLISGLYSVFQESFFLIRQARNNFEGNQWVVDVDIMEAIHQTFLDSLKSYIHKIVDKEKSGSETKTSEEEDGDEEGDYEEATILDKAQYYAESTLYTVLDTFDYIQSHGFVKAGALAICASFLTYAMLRK
eukprot:m.12187 g.12187  ORF g.12187 m.12187 type:complete len:270 (-) comp3961_c1_seq1:76-885(-)